MSDFTLSEGDGLDAGLAAGFASAGDSVLGRLERERGTQIPRVTLRRVPDGGEAPVTRSAAPLPKLTAGRAHYQLHGEFARGGMGVLIEGRDIDLGREVALKVLREDLASRPDVVQRFIEEAQIGGQLQHPGIVPVYELGMMADQRPYFAMKLVRGRTLAALLNERDATQRRRLIDVFAAVCQTMAYAHSRGVVHRDLKPSNVLIGAFGEVQVIDWGLAKLTSSGGVADEQRQQRSRPSRPPSIEAVRTHSSGTGSNSVAGSVMGTPAYMAPEQALGETDKIDERTDVFALGATLCEILTGDPPYLGETEQTVQQAAEAKLDDARARLDACDADAELVALCRECLAPERAARPRSAALVAERVKAYLESLSDRARRAEVQAAEARVRARSSVLMSIAGAVLAVGGLTGWFVWREAHAEERQTLQRSVLADLAQAGAARSERDWAQALTAAERARARLEGRSDFGELEGQVIALLAEVREAAQIEHEAEELERSNRALFAALEEVRQPEGDRIYPTDWALLDQAYERAFESSGLRFDGDVATVLAALQRRGVSVELASAIDEWTSVRRNAERARPAAALASLASGLDPDPLRVRLRESLAAKDLAALREIASQAAVQLAEAPTLWLLGHALAQAGESERAIALLESARRRYPQDYKLAIELARALRDAQPRRLEAAVAHYEAALALRPDRVVVWHDFGRTLIELRRYDDALELFERASELAPSDVHLLHHIANTLSRLERFPDAVAKFEQVLELDPNSGSAHVDLGLAQIAMGEEERGREHLERAVEVAPELPDAQLHLGVARVRVGRFEEGLELVDRAFALGLESGEAHFWRGYTLAQLGRKGEAIGEYEQSAELDPSRADTPVYLSIALQDTGRLFEARDVLEAALRRTPDDSRILAVLTSLLTLQVDERLGGPQRALAPARRLVEVYPNLDLGHVMLAVCLLAQGDPAGARDELDRAAELGDQTPLRIWLQGMCALHMGDTEAAVAKFEQVRDQFDELSRTNPPLRRWIAESQALLAK